jgi:hypothetical protein
MPTRNSMRLSRATPALRSTVPFMHFDGAAHRVDYAAKLDENAVAGALNDAPMMDGDGGIDQIASQPPEP